MPYYRWPEGGAVAQMETTPLASGNRNAVIQVRPDADTESKAKLFAALNYQKIEYFIDTEHGASIIVPELKDDRPLLEMIAGAQGNPQIITSPSDKAEPTKKGSFLEEQPLLVSAGFFTLSNLSFIASGIQRARHNRDGKFTKSDITEMMVGIVMALGDVLLLMYGKEHKKNPLLSFSEGLTDRLKTKGIELPQGNAISTEAIEKSGYFTEANLYLQDHVVAAKGVIKIGGAGLQAHAATKKSYFNKEKFTGGLLLATGWLVTLLLDHPNEMPFAFKEEKQADNQSLSDKIVADLKKNPRKIAASAGGIHAVLKAIGATREGIKSHKDLIEARKSRDVAEIKYAEGKQYDFAWNIMSSCTSSIGNYYFSQSGKKRPQSSEKEAQFEKDFVMVAANVLHHVPDTIRQASIAETADYLSSIKGIDIPKEQIITTLNEKIDMLRVTEHTLASPSRSL